MFAAGRLDEAMAAYRRALAENPRDAAARAGLDAILERARSDRRHEPLVALLLEGYADQGANWDALGWGAGHQLLVGWPERATPDDMAGNTLLLEYLKKSLNRDPGLERRFVELRDEIAKLVVAGTASPAVLELAGAFAEQAWANEYIWPDDTRVPDGPAGAMYRPQAEPRRETVEERALASELPEIAPIVDEVSREVAAMYETNPYPRWIHLARRPAMDVRAILLRDYPHAAQIDFGQGPLEVLMPGAGTGQHPLSVATSYDRARVTAVDLSRTSLAYGKRKARELSITNIDFLRGDILDLPKLGRIFDHVECVGVLHHMRDPKQGLLAISSVTRPGAFIRLGLYGEAGRRIVVKARDEIAAAKLPATLEGLREFRKRVMTGKLRRLRQLTEWEDFWSASLLRDLCFHVQEHRFTIQKLRAFLEGSGLRFIGFEATAGAAARAVDGGPFELYRSRFWSSDRAMTDLANWEQLEREKSQLFAGYAFVCQKI